ncbi:MAG: hypothetical protein ACRDV4_08865 [Acidimicrobiales bacterium]
MTSIGQIPPSAARAVIRHLPRRALVLSTALAATFALATSAVAPGTVSAAANHRASAATGSASQRRSPVPVTGAYPQSMEGTLPPGNPPQNIQPSPDFLGQCSGFNYDDTDACVLTTLQAIDNAREHEGLPAMILPTNWTSLSPQQQLYVATNLERTVRGLAPMSGMASALDQSAAQAAVANEDPVPPAGFSWSTWGSNWAAAVGNPLEAIYFWMYDDGIGSSNIDCTVSNTSGCWGHRDNVLAEMSCGTCVMGSGFDPTAWEGYPSWTELLVQANGSSALDCAWNSELQYLPGSPGGAGLLSPAVGMAPTPDGNGYWLCDSSGGVFTFGDAQFYGSMAGNFLSAPIVGMATTPDGHGYWLVASDGGIFSYGDARFYGSTGGMRLNAPIVGMASTPSGNGYWLVASDGGIFTFGNARFYGSTGSMRLNRPVVGMASAPGGNGYWLVASDGGIFTFGGSSFYGSTGSMRLNRPIVGMATTPGGHGYWLVASDGGIFTFGNAPFRGSTGALVLNAPMVSMATPSPAGYWLAASDGGIFSFNVPFHGSMG